jgi:hypothetical protein
MVFAMYRTYPVFSLIQDEEDVYLSDLEYNPEFGTPILNTVTTEENSPWYVSDINSTALPYALNQNNFDFGVVITIENRLSEECRSIISESFTYAILRNLVQAQVPIYIRYV